MSRGEISQVFVYIMVVIVFAVVFLFGYRAINHFVAEGEKVAFITFKNDIEDAIKSVEFGSVNVYHAERPLRVPSKYTKVCFIDFDTAKNLNVPCTGLSVSACDALKSKGSGWEGAESNVFLTPEGLLPIKVYRIRLKNKNGQPVPTLCIPTAGRLDMRLTGQGTHTVISPN